MHKRCSVGLIVQVRFYDVLLYSVRDVGSDDGFVDISLADDTIVDIASSADGITTNPGWLPPGFHQYCYWSVLDQGTFMQKWTASVLV